jgi:hypothetical protein
MIVNRGITSPEDRSLIAWIGTQSKWIAHGLQAGRESVQAIHSANGKARRRFTLRKIDLYSEHSGSPFIFLCDTYAYNA